MQAILVDILCIFFDFVRTRFAVICIDSIAGVLHAQNAHIAIVGDGLHLLLCERQALSIAVEVEEELRAVRVLVVIGRDVSA